MAFLLSRRRIFVTHYLVAFAGYTLNTLPGVRPFQHATIRNPQSTRFFHQSQRARSRIQKCTVPNLFFRQGDEGSASPPRRVPVKSGVINELKSPTITFPCDVTLDDDSFMKIRFMTHKDLEDVLPLCIEEFGTGPSTRLVDFPLLEPANISDWWDRLYFEPMINLSLRAKMNANLAQPNSNFADPVVLVLCRPEKNSKGEKVVGMVELSLQAPEANKNPPAYPIPLWFKEIYCQLTNQRTEGWVTNMLIDPKCRGLGYSKILMAATEGVAKSWGKDFIYLHADADIRSGRVAQKLYEGLGYEVVTDEDSQFAWMYGNGFNPTSSIRIVEGVALLFYRKQL